MPRLFSFYCVRVAGAKQSKKSRGDLEKVGNRKVAIAGLNTCSYTKATTGSWNINHSQARDGYIL